MWLYAVQKARSGRVGVGSTRLVHSSDVEGQPGTSREAELTADVRATVAVVDVRVQVLVVLGLGGELLAAVEYWADELVVLCVDLEVVLQVRLP